MFTIAHREIRRILEIGGGAETAQQYLIALFLQVTIGTPVWEHSSTHSNALYISMYRHRRIATLTRHYTGTDLIFVTSPSV